MLIIKSAYMHGLCISEITSSMVEEEAVEEVVLEEGAVHEDVFVEEVVETAPITACAELRFID